MDTAFRQGRGGDLSGAIALISTVVAGASAGGYVDVHFHAILQRGELEWLRLLRSDAPQAHAPEQKLETAMELCRIARRNPKHLHLAAQNLRKAAELGVSVQKTIGLLMSWHAHRQRGNDPIWIAVLSRQLHQQLLVVHRKYKQSLRLANATAKSRYRSVASRPIAETAVTIATLASLLEKCGLQEPGRQYRQSAFDLLKFSAAIAIEHGSVDELFNAVMNARVLDRNPDGKVSQWIRFMIEQWPEDSQHRWNAEELMARTAARNRGETFEDDIQTTHRQIHNNLLTSAGIDPTIEPWMSLIELAIKDDDPTRVLIGCEQKIVLKSRLGDPMLDRLGLERANPKLIGCNLHKHKVVGRELDATDEEFNRRYCNACPDKVPRDPN